MNPAAVWSIMAATIGRPQRTGSAIFAIFSIAIMLVHAVFGAGRYGIAFVLFYAGGMGFWWLFGAGRVLIVQRDARRLCVPGVDGTVAVNLILQYAATALVPAAILASWP